MSKIYNKFNFHKHTFCVFKEVDELKIEALKPNHNSKSGSVYYFTEEGVYRVSNHWGRAANCRWRLDSDSKNVNQRTKVGYANWTDFYPNNEQENLFYIEVNWQINEVSFQHKNNPKYQGKEMLRNASETSKVIKTINELLTTDNWAKYLDFDDLDVLRKEIVTLLITTSKTFLEIKRNYTA
ncbi:hypothetical protein LZZ90_12545 [Flavobacterium sp. SM15]|uniref:hypothetical protein n=1 Tax=Flavobacterium sp. SM15 TaxID=2908005 RepID=UPI001EDC89F6|nr:hypothetical protein [Flavobacterium sp. SM15]MCG2612336.1 hypothetical protein [Flavobacterium sp. SM15]